MVTILLFCFKETVIPTFCFCLCCSKIKSIIIAVFCLSVRGKGVVQQAHEIACNLKTVDPWISPRATTSYTYNTPWFLNANYTIFYYKNNEA